ncbi:MAG: DUF1559 domain-containing protein [Phycisphaeraceae bacterium]|nr:DUF1559 domain-containing protein [Phycisphaeraceae bacterium]
MPYAPTSCGISPRRCGRAVGFTLIELLVVISIIGILIGLAMPALSVVRQRARKTACASNLRQVGVAIESYKSDHREFYPVAKYMPDPFLSSSDDPSLPMAIKAYLEASDDHPNEIYRCPGDVMGAYGLSGSSYAYETGFSGRRFEDQLMAKRMGLTISDVVVMRDCDGGDFQTTKGRITLAFFHDLRNLLFADGHAGNY